MSSLSQSRSCLWSIKTLLIALKGNGTLMWLPQEWNVPVDTAQTTQCVFVWGTWWFSMKPSGAFFQRLLLTFHFKVDVGHRESQYVSYFEHSSICTADPVQKYHWTLQSETIIQTQVRSSLKSKGIYKKIKNVNWWRNFSWSQKWESVTCICKLSLIQEQMFSGGIVGGVVEVD